MNLNEVNEKFFNLGSFFYENKIKYGDAFDSLLFRKTEQWAILLTVLFIVVDVYKIFSTVMINVDKQSRRPSST